MGSAGGSGVPPKAQPQGPLTVVSAGGPPESVLVGNMGFGSRVLGL